MENFSTLSERPALRFWGWGYENESLSDEENQLVESMIAALAPQNKIEVSPPSLEDFTLRDPRLKVPEHLNAFISTTTYDRLVHSYGKSYADIVRMFLVKVDNPPDWVAFPKNEHNINDLLAYAGENNIAVIPFGGGTSVCGGVEADIGESFSGSVCIDLEHFNQVLEIDSVSRCARIQAGTLGPDIEKQLKLHGFTLRHFPQSFCFSTLGGWIATRAGGHFASVYTHIDDFVESIRIVTPEGSMETRRLPGSGAGPSADRLLLGSEGTLGVITEAWVRLQSLPIWKASVTVQFESFKIGTEAVRLISQSGLFPSNCRLLDESEVRSNHLSNQTCALLVLGFESADHPVKEWMNHALRIAKNAGGDQSKVTYIKANNVSGSTLKVASTAESWRNAFIRMPYYRNRMVGFGIIADTFETAITWDKFDDLYDGVKTGIESVILAITGYNGVVSCRFTHIYPDGPAPYFSFYAVGDDSGDLNNVLENWRQIKCAANDLIVKFGGTITHHHAVGRDHRSGYEKQTSSLFRKTLAATKSSLDPAGILNPGVLIDPQNREIGQRGSLSRDKKD